MDFAWIAHKVPWRPPRPDFLSTFASCVIVALRPTRKPDAGDHPAMVYKPYLAIVKVRR